MTLKILIFFRPGGELDQDEDQAEGLKRLLNEASINISVITFNPN